MNRLQPIQAQKSLFWTGLLLLPALALASGTLARALRTERFPWYQPWSRHLEMKAAERGLRVLGVEEMRATVEGGLALVFDARAATEFHQGHLPGAMSLPEEERVERAAEYAGFLSPPDPVVVYCSGPACDAGLVVASYLMELGYTNVAVFIGGMEAWSQAGGALER